MKTKIIIAAVISFFVSIFAHAAAPDHLPLTEAEAISNQLAEAHEIVAYLESSSMNDVKGSHISYNHYLEDDERNARTIGDLISAQEWKFALHNWKAEVSLRVFVYNQEGEVLFRSNHGFQLEEVESKEGTTYVVPEWAKRVTLYPQWDTVLNVEGALFARVNLRHENGWINRYEYIYRDENSGDLVLDWWMLGEYGEVIFYFGAPNEPITTVAYSLTTGDRLDPVTVSTWMETSVNNVWDVDPAELEFVMPSYPKPNSLLIETHVVVEGQYRINVSTEKGIVPEKVFIKSGENEVWQEHGKNGFEINLAPGVYHIRFEWSDEALSQDNGPGGKKG